MAHDVDSYHSDSFMTLLATITPSSFQNSNLSLNSLPPWLVEIHTNFIELQHQLQELNPECNSESYVAKDVLATKSAFLRSRSTALFSTNLVLDASQPPSPYVVEDGADDTDDTDNTAAVADDTMDIDPNPGSSGCLHVNTDMADLSNEATAIFPYTIQYMDLTVLKLTTKDLRVPQLMLFRHEWASIIDIFNERKKGMRGSTFFTGQPGIGKTCMLYCILILCIVNAQSIMFQDMQGEVFVIDDTVHPPKDTPAALEDVDDVLTLVDADGASCQPNPYLFRDNKYRILLTSSPRGSADQRWLTQMVQDLHAVFVMELWSGEEIVVASFVYFA
ncbi:hypothetical protein L208DRAFT_1399781 [Tricholoma matsutake]|nr:hypothetical protein L208DRAFT_1399781 [Tricholoma matsutake 945]